jgi:hypothetical protein
MADQSPVPAPRLDEDDLRWLAAEAVIRPDTKLGAALTAAAIVHELHLAGGCS